MPLPPAPCTADERLRGFRMLTAAQHLQQLEAAAANKAAAKKALQQAKKEQQKQRQHKTDLEKLAERVMESCHTVPQTYVGRRSWSSVCLLTPNQYTKEVCQGR